MKRLFSFMFGLLMMGTLHAVVSYDAATQTLIIKSHTSANEIHDYPDTRILIIETAEGLDDMGYQFGQYLTHMESLILPSDITYIPPYTFKNCFNLVDVNWGDLVNLKTIGVEAFMQTNIGPTFTVPNSVETIKNGAFAMCNNLKTLIFDEDSQIQLIEQNAFKQSESGEGRLSDVYVNVSPAREIVCEKGAFDKYHTCGQTQVGTVTTRLHYPAELFEYYVGTYKSTLYDQNYDVKDVNGHWVLDEYGQRIHSYGIITQSILNNAFEGAGNGWQQFMSSGIPIGSGSLYRTYSDEVAYRVPATSEFQVYMVYDYDKEANIAYCIQMKPNDIIPAKTGIIVHSNVEATIYMEFVKNPNPSEAYDNELYPNNLYHYHGNQYYTNYLKPINGNLHIDNVEVVNGVKTYRNYFFNNGTTAAMRPGPDWDDKYLTYGWGFFRAVSKDYRVFNKAFLHLPANMTDDDSEHINDSGNLPQDNASAQSKSFSMFITNGAEMEIECHCIPTSLECVETENNNVYYTLEGIKVKNPTKGVYVKNKKKIILR